MAVFNKDTSTDGPSISIPTPSPTSMKLPHLLRRSSTADGGERPRDKDAVKSPFSDPERRLSISTIPLRLRRRKTISRDERHEHEAAAAERLGRLFFSLPPEILAQMITHLEISDIYRLRLTSRTFHHILNCNVNAISRRVLPQCLAPQVGTLVLKDLFPVGTSTDNPLSTIESEHPSHPSLYSPSHPFTILRRQSIIDRQIYNVLAFVQVKVYMTRTATRLLSVIDHRQRLIEVFQRPAWIVTHFLERYRDILIYQHPRHSISETTLTSSSRPPPSLPSSLLSAPCAECTRLARTVISHYPQADILPAWHFYQLSMEHLRLAMRPPSSTSPLTDRFRGRSKAPTCPNDLAIFVILGGVPEIRKVAMMQGSHRLRISTFSDFVASVRGAVETGGSVTTVPGNDGGGVNRRMSLGGGDGSGGGGGGGGEITGSKKNNRLSLSISRTPTPPSLSPSPLSPPFAFLTHDLISSLPDINTFFYDVWKERIAECAPPSDDDREVVLEPYHWLQQAMSGSGVDFGQSRTPEPPLALGASPV